MSPILSCRAVQTIHMRTIIALALGNIVTFILHPYTTLQTTIPSPLSYCIDSKDPFETHLTNFIRHLLCRLI
ncbi:hypothetical protein DID88_002843 [Monilinia fructigena]|uniref:Uncharacterized protein n=1 Tax=Monilinia fructigena TaxID=38457 RepID=A0A395INB8_9HELO|nr:hypothetical protein DID88_002843 [Monilinia fructigena]